MKKKKMRIRRKLDMMHMIGLGLFLFPLVVGWMYTWDHPQIIAASCGELLSYYSVAFGLFGSAYVYFTEKRKTQQEQERQMVPRLCLTAKLIQEDAEALLEVILHNESNYSLRNVHVYDLYVAALVEKELTIRLRLNESADVRALPEHTFDISGWVPEGEDGFPKEILFFVDDREGNIWECPFCRKTDGLYTYYLPERFFIT